MRTALVVLGVASGSAQGRPLSENGHALRASPSRRCEGHAVSSCEKHAVSFMQADDQQDEHPWLEKVTTITITSHADANLRDPAGKDAAKAKIDALTENSGGVNKEKMKYLQTISNELKEASEISSSKGLIGVLIWLEEVLNFACPELAERECEADHLFEKFAKMCHDTAPELEVIRIKVPIYAMSELGKYGIMDPYDLLNGEHEEVEGGQGTAFPRLTYLRTGEDKTHKAHGRLFATYELYGELLTSDNPKQKDTLKTWLKSRSKTGLCTREDNPAAPVNGCCAR